MCKKRDAFRFLEGGIMGGEEQLSASSQQKGTQRFSHQIRCITDGRAEQQQFGDAETIFQLLLALS